MTLSCMLQPRVARQPWARSAALGLEVWGLQSCRVLAVCGKAVGDGDAEPPPCDAVLSFCGALSSGPNHFYVEVLGTELQASRELGTPRPSPIATLRGQWARVTILGTLEELVGTCVIVGCVLVKSCSSDETTPPGWDWLESESQLLRNVPFCFNLSVVCFFFWHCWGLSPGPRTPCPWLHPGLTLGFNKHLN